MRITKELFRFVHREREEEPLPREVGYGYFKDVFRRFFRLGAARAAVGAVAAIALFSIVFPLFFGKNEGLMDPYYAKMPPRIAIGDGALGGGISRRLGDEGLTRIIAIGREAGEEYSPILSIAESEGRTREVRLDAYLEVGFIYKTVRRAEYEKMLAWEAEHGVQLLYPLIAYNEFSADASDANLWYKTSPEGLAVSYTDGEYAVTEVSYDMPLEDNYLRDGSGEPVYQVPFGGGSAESGGVRVRVLYHNYYLYRNGSEPSYLFGTDSQGYDLALRVAGGIRVSLLIALSVSAINLVIGAFVGALEGYYGGAVDLIVERVTDVLSGVPFIVVATLFQIYLSDMVGAIPSLLFAFVLTGWLGTANRVRGQFFRYKSSEYVLAAKTLGLKNSRIIWRHIFPNTLGTLITASALVIPGVIFTESMLSFLGIVNLGAEGVTSLGTLLSDASGVWVNYPHLMLFPAAVISLIMISFNVIGNSLRDAFNPGRKGGD